MSALYLITSIFFAISTQSKNLQNYCWYINEPGQNLLAFPDTVNYAEITESNTVIPSNSYTPSFCNWDQRTQNKPYSWKYECCEGDSEYNICMYVYEGTKDCDEPSATSYNTYQFDSTQREFNCDLQDQRCLLSWDYYTNTAYNTSCNLEGNYAHVNLVNGGCAPQMQGGYVGVTCYDDTSFDWGFFGDDKCSQGDVTTITTDTCPAGGSNDAYGQVGYKNIDCPDALPTTTLPESTIIFESTDTSTDCSWVLWNGFLPIPMSEKDSNEYCVVFRDFGDEDDGPSHASFNWYCEQGRVKQVVYSSLDCDQDTILVTEDISSYTTYACAGSGSYCNTFKLYRNLADTIEDCLDTISEPAQAYILVNNMCTAGVKWFCLDDYEQDDVEEGITYNWGVRFYQNDDCTGDYQDGFNDDDDYNMTTTMDPTNTTEPEECIWSPDCALPTTPSPTEDPETGSTLFITAAVAFVMFISVFFI